MSRSRTARPGEKWRQGGGWTPRAGRDTRRPETAGGALVSRRHGPWTSIRVCANVCVTAARVGSESEKRRDKLDGRAKGRTGSLWAPGRLGKCIGCGPPDTFEKYRHRGTGVPATPPGHRERRARVRAGRTVFLVSGRRARGRGRGARRGERSVRLPPGLLGRAPLSRRIEYTNRRVPLYTSTGAVHTTFLMWGVSLQR